MAYMGTHKLKRHQNHYDVVGVRCQYVRQTRQNRSGRTKGGISFAWMLVVSALVVGALVPFQGSEVVYIRAAESAAVPIAHAETVDNLVENVDNTSAVETVQDKIMRIGHAHGISTWAMTKIVKCESGFDPMAHRLSSVEDSWGIVQVNRYVHNVTIEQATDPDFALEFLVSHWGQRHDMWVVCSRGT